jgi:hypothetical protein
VDIRKGWVRQTFRSPGDWRISYERDHRALSRRILDRLDNGPGFAVITQTPVADMTTDEVQRFAPEFLAAVGQPLLQGHGEEATLGWLVRDEGMRRFQATPSEGASEYQPGVFTSKTPDALEVHNDAAMKPYGHDVDLVGLLAHRSAKAGGESILISSHTVYALLRQEFPGELERLCQPFAFERGHILPPGEERVLWEPVFKLGDGRLQVRCNRQRIEMAPTLTGISLGEEDIAALDALDNVLARPELQLRLLLQEGDCLVTDEHAVLHGRSAFVDHLEPDRRRCLVRVQMQRR